jgi:hypothetical protein
VVVIFDDQNIPKFHDLVRRLRRTLIAKWGIQSRVCVMVALPPIPNR